jgi:hypothetical protein
MTVGPGRFRIRRAGSPEAGSASEGLVVQAVLLMAMVTTIGVLVVAARVAGSRQSAAAATLNNEARQAAEYGFSETVAEMNRDSKSYLWVTKFSSWNTVTEQNLINCGVASTNAPSSNPILGVGSNVALPRSSELSYKITNYQAPITLGTDDCGSGTFGNLIGGTGEITIVGKLNRGPGSITTYTLKRTVTVKRADQLFAPFGNPASELRGFDPNDPRFPSYPIPPGGSAENIECEPGPPSLINCSYDSLPPESFSSSTDTSAANHFPYLPSGLLSQACNYAGGKIQCLVNKLEIDSNANMIVTTARPTDQKIMPVEIFLLDRLIISSGAKLSGDNWSRFRIFGASSGSCGTQRISINRFTNTTNNTIESNLQNAFVWLKFGKLEFDSSINSIPFLFGSVCESDVPSTATSTYITNFKLFESLSPPYGLDGVSPRQLRFFYRGFGFSELSISS